MPVVEAVGSASNCQDKNLGELIETAKVQAIKDAQAAGITDPDAIRELVLAARDRVKKDARA